MAFTGTPEEIRFKGLLNQVLLENELGGASPYALSSARIGRSGYSFGIPQYDLSVNANTDARNLFRRVLENAKDTSENFIIDDGNPATSRADDTLVQLIYSKALLPGGRSLSPSEKGLIDAALNSTFGRQEIDGALDGTLDDRIADANRVIELSAGTDRAFLESDLGKLFLCDYDNQFGIDVGGPLERFVQGKVVFGITKQGVLGVDDLLNFYFRTQQATQTPYDPVRRFANVVEVAGGYTPPDVDVDEAKGVLQAYTFFVVPNRGRISAANSAALAEFMTRVIDPAKAPVIAAFGQGQTIDGEVLVGQDTPFPGDILEGTASGDLLFGEKGDDVLRGGAGTDVLYGGDGSDTISGGTENDFLFGEAGIDTLQGGDGNDTIEGGTGTDYLVGGKDNDILKGGAGFDTYIYNAGDGNDDLEGGVGDDTLFGEADNDVLFGDDPNDPSAVGDDDELELERMAA